MIYKRTFKFAASHYGPWHHGIVWAAKQNGSMSWDALQQLMSKLHGHNFRVDVSFSYNECEHTFGVWDQDIEDIVMEWNNCNISMHPDLFQEEWISSTELTASVLAHKLLGSFPRYVNNCTVILWETDDISVCTTALRKEAAA